MPVKNACKIVIKSDIYEVRRYFERYYPPFITLYRMPYGEPSVRNAFVSNVKYWCRALRIAFYTSEPFVPS